MIFIHCVYTIFCFLGSVSVLQQLKQENAKLFSADQEASTTSVFKFGPALGIEAQNKRSAKMRKFAYTDKECTSKPKTLIQTKRQECIATAFDKNKDDFMAANQQKFADRCNRIINYFVALKIFNMNQLRAHYLNHRDDVTATYLIHMKDKSMLNNYMSNAQHIVVHDGLREYIKRSNFMDVYEWGDQSKFYKFMLYDIPFFWLELSFNLACFMLSPQIKRSTFFISGDVDMGKSVFINACLKDINPIGKGESNGENFAWNTLVNPHFLIVQDDQNTHLGTESQVELMKCVMEGKPQTLNIKYQPKTESVYNKILIVTNKPYISVVGCGTDQHSVDLMFKSRYYDEHYVGLNKLPIYDFERYTSLFRWMLRQVASMYTDIELGAYPHPTFELLYSKIMGVAL